MKKERKVTSQRLMTRLYLLIITVIIINIRKMPAVYHCIFKTKDSARYLVDTCLTLVESGN